MFNGIIKYTGSIKNIYKNNKYITIEVYSKMNFSKNEIGSSISCSGVCLTVEKCSKNLVSFYVSKETLSRTVFKFLKRGDIINLEKSIKYGQRISGHFVQGHVDTVSSVKKIMLIGKSWLINFSISSSYKKYLVQKGSITINGVSLTIAKILKDGFQIAVIPKTLQLTNLIYLKKKDLVNIEIDILGKYIKKFINKKK
tara:strand:+ start:53 stop:646 length:594 start_codon:yes stop_codon:yes gene_type:complete